MKGFELKLDNSVYKCTSSVGNKQNQNWHIESQTNDVSVIMTIPIESKVSRSQCILFVEVFHEALTEGKKKQDESLRFPQQLK